MIRSRMWAASLCVLVGGCAGLDARSFGPISEVWPAATPAALGEADIADGLKSALAQGVTAAIAGLGRTDGFWGNAAVRIPLPRSLEKAEDALRMLGQGARIDAFQLTLNRAAEQAVPQVAEVFGDAVRRMTLADARTILQGQPDAATQYFRRATAAALPARVRPYIEAATQKVGVTQQYKALMSDYGPLLQRAGVADTDLDGYVTDKALDGLFHAIAAEEARIRRDPAARSTEILRRVFGAS